ncbi:MAG TPA: MgtC/SapB family protein [Anaerovoracaceae bacterium]|nr:MgtC/SapB family protein [Anaerovoracaceae bacterium]
MDWIHGINVGSILLRLTLAFIFGGVVGLERGTNKHQAGLRTHILVCIGATLAMMTNSYIYEHISYTSDPGRLGAQVISGIGFLGVGLILVTSRNKVKGLTTAAGLWASACIGLALGAGFYVGAIVAGTFVFIALALLPRLEVYFYNRSRIMTLYVELDSMSNARGFLSSVRSKGFIIIETHVNKSDAIVSDGYNLDLAIRISKKITHVEVVELLSTLPGVFLVEELG